MGKKILVIDDDEGIIEVVQIVLEGEGYNVRINWNGNGLQYIADDLPDLILLDVLLSGIDGREICRVLKRNKATRYIPIIMLSAHSDASKVASDSGADGFLEKPFEVDALIHTVKKYLASTGSAVH